MTLRLVLLYLAGLLHRCLVMERWHMLGLPRHFIISCHERDSMVLKVEVVATIDDERHSC